MLVKYRPYVQYKAHSADTLHVQVDRKNIFYSIPKSFKFDYSLFKKGVNASDLPAALMQYCKNSDLLEILEQNIELENPLSFLALTNKTHETYVQQLETLRKLELKILNLTMLDMSVSILDEYVQVSKIPNTNELYKLKKEKKEHHLFIVITDNYQRPELIRINEFFVGSERNWLLVLHDDAGITVGPYFSSEEKNSCFNCFNLRIISNEEAKHFPFKKDLALTASLAAEVERFWLQYELLKRIPNPGYYQRKLVFFDCHSNVLKNWNYLPYPLCPVCRP